MRARKRLIGRKLTSFGRLCQKHAEGAHGQKLPKSIFHGLNDWFIYKYANIPKPSQTTKPLTFFNTSPNLWKDGFRSAATSLPLHKNDLRLRGSISLSRAWNGGSESASPLGLQQPYGWRLMMRAASCRPQVAVTCISEPLGPSGAALARTSSEKTHLNFRLG